MGNAAGGTHRRGLRWGVLLAVVIITSASCGDSSEVATDGTQSPLMATCGSVEFPTMPPDVDAFPALDEELQSVFDEFTTGPLSVESAFIADFDMRVAERSDTRLVLFGQGPDGGYADVVFERRDNLWTARSWGGCTIQVSAPGYGSATTQLDPDHEPDPASTTLHLVIQERECASGQAPLDREVLPVVVEGDTTIEITTLVEPVTGDADCPSNPWFPITVDLTDPIGDRTIIDMQSPPGAERTWPPSLDDL